MQQRTLGPFSVSAIGLGCMNLSHAYGTPPSPEAAEKLLLRTLDLGVTMLDTAALYASCIEQQSSARAALCLRSGFLSLRRLAESLGLEVDDDPSPDEEISVSRTEFDAMRAELAAGGLSLRDDAELSWRDFKGWRVNYDRALVGLAAMVMAPDGRWSSDRGEQWRAPKRR